MRTIFKRFAVAAAIGFMIAIGGMGAARAQPVNTITGIGPLANFGITDKHYTSAASNNSTLVVANSTTQVHGYFGINAVNTNSSTAYLKLFDKATAPTCGTDIPFATYQLAQNVPVTKGSFFSRVLANGLGFCIVANIADTDNTNATTGISVDVGYK